MIRLNLIYGAFLNSKPMAFIISLLISWISGTEILLVAVFLFVGFDLATGIGKVIKKEGIRKITSKGIRRTVEKIIGFSIAIILANILDQLFFKNLGYICLLNFTGAIILISEFISIMENLSVITGNTIFSQIKKVVSNIFKNKIKIS